MLRILRQLFMTAEHARRLGKLCAAGSTCSVGCVDGVGKITVQPVTISLMYSADHVVDLIGLYVIVTNYLGALEEHGKMLARFVRLRWRSSRRSKLPRALLRLCSRDELDA